MSGLRKIISQRRDEKYSDKDLLQHAKYSSLPRMLAETSWHKAGKKMIKILILCTGNSCRSQMAEGFLKQYEVFKVQSAGTKPAAEVAPLAIEVMQESGIDISQQQPKLVDKFLNDSFDYVITVCDDARESCPVFLGKVKQRLHIGFEDPAGKEIAVFRKVRDEIETKMAEFLITVNAEK